MKNRIDITVGDGADYHFVVTAHDEGYSIMYNQDGYDSTISFGSLAEMQQVAQAMLAVVKMSKEFQ